MAGRLTIDDNSNPVSGGVTFLGKILSDTTLVVESVNAKAVALVDNNGNQITAFTGKPQVTPDGGSTFYPLQGNSSGIISSNDNLQSGTNVVGAALTYQEAVARNIAPGVARKVLKASATTNSTIGSWTDQGGNTYTTVTSGKTLYISQIIVSAIALTSSTGNYATVAIGDGSNQPLIVAANSFGPVSIPINGMHSLVSGATLSAVLTLIGSANAVYVTIIGWEE